MVVYIVINCLHAVEMSQLVEKLDTRGETHFSETDVPRLVLVNSSLSSLASHPIPI